MYTTRSLSLYKYSQDAVSELPEGPNSGYLVIQDDESTPSRCIGLFKDKQPINNPPFPQNKLLSFEYHVMTSAFPYGGYASINDVYLIPVINQPLSSNTYYAINANDGKYIGEAYASSKKENKANIFCFGCPYVDEVNPRPLDPEDLYQQFKFSVQPARSNYTILQAKSVASDGCPPEFLSRQGLRIYVKTPKNFTLSKASGVDSTLRAHLPDFSLCSLTQEHSKPTTVGKWYCPFMFIKDGTEKDQMEKSMFYEMTLEQKWQQIFATERSCTQGKVARVDVVVPTEMVRIVGCKAVQEEKNDNKGVVWFETIGKSGMEEQVGLSSLIVERMMWEEERAGWVKVKKKKARVNKDVEYEGIGEWRSFGCYVLIETFVLKSNDGKVVLTYDFWHTHKIRGKWE